MALMSGQYLTPNCFEWPAGTKKDGTKREAGSYKAFYVYEDGPSPATSPVVEVQVPDQFHAQFDKWQLSLQRLSKIKVYVEHIAKGKARLLGFVE